MQLNKKKYINFEVFATVTVQIVIIQDIDVSEEHVSSSSALKFVEA
jgi:hypothetical protein